MKSTNPPRTRWARSALGGLIAVLMMFVFSGPSDATVIRGNRYQVTATTTFPYSAVVEIVLPPGLGRCTGFMIGPDTVATAGHCVYDRSLDGVSGGWFDTAQMTVYPGRNGTSTPYGSCGVVKSFASNGWTYNQDERYDYGALKLNCTIGYSTNWLDYGAPAGVTVGDFTRLCGYPSDKTIDTQWCSDNQIWATDAYQAYYENDTAPRMSGGPVLGWTGTAWYVMAIHTMPVHGTAWNHSSFNHGTLITSAVANDLTNWRVWG